MQGVDRRLGDARQAEEREQSMKSNSISLELSLAGILLWLATLGLEVFCAAGRVGSWAIHSKLGRQFVFWEPTALGRKKHELVK
jgi:hypothetical protein